MTREKVVEIMNYYKEHKVTYKSRLKELKMYGWRLGPDGHYHRQVPVSSRVLSSDTAVLRIRNQHKRIYRVRMV